MSNKSDRSQLQPKMAVTHQYILKPLSEHDSHCTDADDEHFRAIPFKCFRSGGKEKNFDFPRYPNGLYIKCNANQCKIGLGPPAPVF